MAWYDVTYYCGHEGRIQLYGPGKEREWELKKCERQLCPECYEAERKRKREEDAIKAAQLAAEMNLPALCGSEKQIAWAEKLRIDFIENARELVVADNPRKCVFIIDGVNEEITSKEYMELVLREDRAKWWIDHRDAYLSRSVGLEVVTAARQRKKKAAEEAAKPAVEQPAPSPMLRPANPTHECVVTIKAYEKCVAAFCEKNDDFIQIVKQHGYRWSSEYHQWRLSLGITTGSASDRMAELGCTLLANGFIISVADDEARSKIINSDYEPLYMRWAFKLVDENLICLRWERGRDDIYKAARKLPGAKWSSSQQGILISPNVYKSIRDFVAAFDFRVTPGAEAALEASAEAERNALLVRPSVKQAEQPRSNGYGDILSSSREVLPDLKDDDDDA